MHVCLLPKSVILCGKHGFVVAHAPQSGIPEDQRQAWWASLTEQFIKFVKDEEVYVLIDANAEPGPTDGTHVGPRQTKHPNPPNSCVNS